MTTDLLKKFADPSQGVYFVGTTPPRANIEDEQMSEIADKLLERLSDIDYDGLIVYDIQDESARIDKPRPFPFMGTKDPRVYSKLLSDKSQRSIITYKSVSQRDGEAFTQWLNEAWTKYSVRNLVLVGSPSRSADIKLSLQDAYRVLNDNEGPFALGGVTIAERHAKKGNEHQRLQEKSLNGCSYFVSQAVYDAQATVDLVTSYGQACEAQGIKPCRIILTFTPCGSAKTLEFMNWLGISVPPAVASEIIGSGDPLAESIRICRNSLDIILDSCLPLGIPIGLNIESLTNRKEEIEASIRLFKLLKTTLDERLKSEFSSAQ